MAGQGSNKSLRLAECADQHAHHGAKQENVTSLAITKPLKQQPRPASQVMCAMHVETGCHSNRNFGVTDCAYQCAMGGVLEVERESLAKRCDHLQLQPAHLTVSVMIWTALNKLCGITPATARRHSEGTNICTRCPFGCRWSRTMTMELKSSKCAWRTHHSDAQAPLLTIW